LEVWLVSGEEQEGLPQLVFRQIQLKFGRAVVAQMILIEIDRRAARTIIKERIVVERRNHGAFESIEKVLAELADSSTRVSKPGKAGDERETARHPSDIGH
jgi:hypothetical protein